MGWVCHSRTQENGKCGMKGGRGTASCSDARVGEGQGGGTEGQSKSKQTTSG